MSNLSKNIIFPNLQSSGIKDTATRDYLRRLIRVISEIKTSYVYTSASASWNPGSIADGDEEAKEITVKDISLGDFVMVSFSLDIKDLVLNAQVTAANTVTCVLANNTGAAVNLAAGTVYVRVFKK